jgi:hypothetical protein
LKAEKSLSFLEDMVQSSTKVVGIKPKVAKFCPGVEAHTLANHYMLERLKPCRYSIHKSKDQ